MKKAIIGIVTLAFLGSSVYYALGNGSDGGSTAMAAQPPAIVKVGDKVVSEGKVVPVRSAALSLPAAGIVAKLPVAEGDAVQTGQVLLALNAERQSAAVSQAEAELKRAEASLNMAKAGPRPQEIDAAKATVDAAQGQLGKLTQEARPEDLSAAAATLAANKAALAKAEATLSDLQAKPKAEQVRAAELDLERAKNTLWATQIDRDGVKGNGAAPEYMGHAGDAIVAAAETAVASAVENLKTVSKPAEASDVRAAEEAVASAKIAVTSAQAKLDALKAPVRQSDIAAAEAEVRRTQAQLGLLQAGPRAEAIAAAEAEVAAAKAALELAKVALAESELKAPFTSIVASLDLKVGEQVAPATPVIQLADLSAYQVETTDLTELNVTRVHEGDSTTVTFDAVPGLALAGKVSRIKAMGVNKQGDIVYTVTVKLDTQDAQLRWNMTATVTIEPKM